MRPAEVDDFVLAYVVEHPGATAREVAEALGNPKPRSRERAQANAALKRLGDRGAIAAEGYPHRWTAVELEPRRPVQDAEYVEIVIERLGELWHVIPTEHRHAVEWCMVDLQRALGTIESGIDLALVDAELLPSSRACSLPETAADISADR